MTTHFYSYQFEFLYIILNFSKNFCSSEWIKITQAHEKKKSSDPKTAPSRLYVFLVAESESDVGYSVSDHLQGNLKVKSRSMG